MRERTDESRDSDDERLDSLIAEYLEAVDAGREPSRERLLDENPELRERLQAFFDDDDRLRHVGDDGEEAVEVDAPTLDPAAETGGDFDAPTVLPGQRTALDEGERIRYFGDYELLEEIARGGMGVVYKAMQINLKRTVALKMILAGQFAGDADVQRFQAEAEAAAQLDHQGIVPIYEIGQHGGQHYFSMAFVEGHSLADQLHDGPLPPREAAELLAKVSEAIAYAHERGIVHRDLKPANVLIDADGTPRVTDFGLAKRTETDSGLTGTGQILGTPSYMPPEQASGRTEEVGPLADVYSLGAILYCTLTGRPPFQAANVMDTLMQVLEREPTAPRELNPEVPRDLETICLKCLRKEAARRYESADDLTADLNRFLAGEPILARPVGRIERGWKWVHRHPTVTTLASLAALSLVVGTTVSLAMFFRERDARIDADEAVVKASEARGEAREAQEVAEQRLAANYFSHGLREYDDGRLTEAIEGLVTAYELTPKDSPLRAGRRNVLLDRAVHGGRLDGPVLRGEILAYSPTGEHVLLRETERIQTGTFVRMSQPVTASFLRSSPTGERIGGNLPLAEFAAFSEDGSRVTIVANRGFGMIVNEDGGMSFEPRPGMYQTFRTETGEPLHEPRELPEDARILALDPKGRRLVTWEETRFQLWNVETGASIAEMETDWKVRTFGLQASFDATGTRFVTSSRGKVVVRDSETGDPLHEFSGMPADEFDPSGRYLLVRGREVGLWELETGRLVGEASGGEGDQSVVFRFAPDGETLATWHARRNRTPGSNEVQLRRTSTFEPVGEPIAHFDEVLAVTFSPVESRVATSGADRLVRFHDPSKGDSFGRPILLDEPADDLVFSADGRLLATRSGRIVQVWDVLTAEPVAPPFLHAEVPESLRFTRNGEQLVTTQGQGGRLRTCVWRVGEPTATPLEGFRGISAVSPNGKWAGSGATRSDRMDIGRTHIRALEPTGDRFWDDPGTNRSLPLDHGFKVLTYGFDFHPTIDGLVVTAGSNKVARLWNVAARSRGASLPHEGEVLAARFVGDGSRIVTVDHVRDPENPREAPTRRVWIWGLHGSPISGPVELQKSNDRKPSLTPLGSRLSVIRVRISRDGSRIALTGIKDTEGARVYDAATGEFLLGPLKGTVGDVDLTADGKRIVVLDPNTVRVVDVESGETIGEVMRVAGVDHVRFIAKDSLVLTGNGTNVRVWDAWTGIPLAEPIPHGGFSFAYDGSERRLLVAGSALPLPIPVPPPDEELRDWIETHSGVGLSWDTKRDRR